MDRGYIIERIEIIRRAFKPRRLLQLLVLCLILIPPVIKLLSAMKLGAGGELWPLTEILLVLISSVILGAVVGGDIGRISDKISAIALWACGWTLFSFVLWLAVDPFVKVVGMTSLFRFHVFLPILSLTGGALGFLAGSFFEEPAYGVGAAFIVLAICLCAVFWANLFLGGSSGHSPLLLKFAIDTNPVILTSSLLGGDPMHTKYLYEISEVSFYRFRYPKVHVIMLEYIGSALILCALSWVFCRFLRSYRASLW
jgi:hypothetical protein